MMGLPVLRGMNPKLGMVGKIMSRMWGEKCFSYLSSSDKNAIERFARGGPSFLLSWFIIEIRNILPIS